MARLLALPTVLAVVLTVLAATATVAVAAPTITEQGTASHPFTFLDMPASLSVGDGADGQEVTLARTAIVRISKGSPVYDGTVPDPRSIEVLPDGHLLFTDRSSSLVAEVTRAGDRVWALTTSDDPDLQHPFSAQRFTREGRELTLIADRWSYRVWAVDTAKSVVWQYGVTNEPGTGVNHLADPFFAQYSDADGGTVLITDCNGGNRVIEVRYDDYRAGAPDNGFTEKSIVWQYGTTSVEGTGPDQLDKPHCAQRLASGNVLITDADAARVIEVDRATKDIVWQYGVTNEPGAGAGRLEDPNQARRLSDGDTLIVDTANRRVLRVSGSKEVDVAYDLTTEGRPPWATKTDSPDPRAAAYTADNLLAVADTQFLQIVLLGYQLSAQATSASLDCGAPGVRKAFAELAWKGDAGPLGTGIAIDYRLDDGKWTPCKGIGASHAYDFPAGTVGKTIAYRVALSTTNHGHTPVLDSIVVQSTRARTGGGGGGGGSATSGGSGNSGESGVYAYPSTAQGGTGTSGAGSGSGGSGSGGGGGGSGSNMTGTASTAAGSGSSSTAQALDVPVQSTGSGAAQSVQGYEVQGEEGVSGVPLRAAEGFQAAEPERPGSSVPVAALIGAAFFVAAALFVPWPCVAARIRSIADFDHTRPARFLPFRPLGR